MAIEPLYLSSYRSGALKEKAGKAGKLLASCRLCPRECGVDRLKGQSGFCKSGFLPRVSSYNAHHGEEPPISGVNGSGTIFFSHCNLTCIYCQNWPISQQGQGRDVSIEKLAEMMLELQERGCHNINFVTPSHMVAQILLSLEVAIPMGLKIPLVYNSSGYDSLNSLELLDEVIDIYMPDIRYSDQEASKEYSGAYDYPAVNQAALKEMWRQVGELQTDSDGIACRGLLVRHLVLPNGLSQTRKALEFLSREISPSVHLSLMSQFFPAHHALQNEGLGRNITFEEYRQALEWAEEFGLDNGWHQELDETGGGPPDRIVKAY